MDQNIEQLRKQIDSLDEKLVEILAERMQISRKIGELKKQSNTAILDMDRWQEVTNRIMQKAQSLQISEELVKNIFEKIHEYSLKLQGK